MKSSIEITARHLIESLLLFSEKPILNRIRGASIQMDELGCSNENVDDSSIGIPVGMETNQQKRGEVARSYYSSSLVIFRRLNRTRTKECGFHNVITTPRGPYRCTCATSSSAR